MTTSKLWALVFGLVVVAALAAWLNRDHSQLAELTGSAIDALPRAQPSPDRPASPPPAASTPTHLSEATPMSQPAPVSGPAPEPMGSAPPAPKAAPPDTGTRPADAAVATPRTTPPHFDVVRVEPHGDTVVAGNGEPNAKIALLASGKVVAETRIDRNGQFVLLPPALTPGGTDLTLRQTPDHKAASDSAQTVAVSVPKAVGGSVVVALAEPGKPTKLLTPPAEDMPKAPRSEHAPQAASAAAAASASKAKLAIRSVDLENGTGFFAVGTAAPGTHVRIYLNNAPIASVVAGPDGGWSLKIGRGLTGGHYAVRADAGADGTRVTARVEVPFDVPVAMAEPKVAASAAAPAARLPQPAAPGPLAANGPLAAAGPIALAANPPTRAAPSPTMPKPTNAAGPALASFDRAAAAGVQLASAPAPAPPSAPSPQDAIVDQVETTQVVAGDNLWNISQSRLGKGTRYTQIYAANADQIRDPNLIYPGQIFVVPAK